MSYFLISVSNKTNLDLCIKYALAGFTDSINGLWTFMEVQQGDYVSFLYGARVFNLYKVIGKKAFKNASQLPPWPPVTFKMSGKTYHFPFRLFLRPIRKLNEPMVKPEFAYVAENLLLRGGYRKTHFQADRTTLHAVSQMGELYNDSISNLDLTKHKIFEPKLTWNKNLENIPEIFKFQELMLQSLIRHHLSNTNLLYDFFRSIGMDSLNADDFEVLGEKALPEGHVDLLIKDAQPVGLSRKIIIEIKTSNANIGDVKQLASYVDELGSECILGVLIARYFSKKTVNEAKNNKIACCTYWFKDLNEDSLYSFNELLSQINLEVVE